MKQPDLFGEPGLEPAVQQIARQEREQTRQLTRVAGSLKHIILAWCEQRCRRQAFTFHLSDLVAGVQAARRTNAASVDRVLRLLRSDGCLNYRVLDRGSSLYELLKVG